MRKKKKSGPEKRTVFSRKDRVGDKLIETTVVEIAAVVSFNDIIEACEWDYDPDAGSIFDDDCWYEHELVRPPEYYDDTDAKTRAANSRGNGRSFREVNVSGHGYPRYKFVELSRSSLKDLDDSMAYDKAHGMSKQMVYEKRQRSERARVEKIIEYLNENPTVEECSCDFGDYSAHLCGIWESDDYKENEKYHREVEMELADEIAGEMTDDGFVVEDIPTKEDRQRMAGYRYVTGFNGNINLRYLKFDRLESLRAKWRPLLKSSAERNPALAKHLINWSSEDGEEDQRQRDGDQEVPV